MEPASPCGMQLVFTIAKRKHKWPLSLGLKSNRSTGVFSKRMPLRHPHHRSNAPGSLFSNFAITNFINYQTALYETMRQDLDQRAPATDPG